MILYAYISNTTPYYSIYVTVVTQAVHVSLICTPEPQGLQA